MLRWCIRIFNRSTLVAFWTKHPVAEQALRLWFSIAERASWRSPAEIRAHFASASFVANDRVVFDIGGNKYRLIAVIHFDREMVFVRHVLTHKEYDEGKWKHD